MFDTMQPENINVALIAGGTSGERSISLASAQGAGEALREAGFNVTQLDTADKNDLIALIEGTYDVAFLCLHGKDGEDGTVQGFLELIGLPYTCSGVFASALAMDKSKCKPYYERAGIPVPPSFTVCSGQPVTGAALFDEIGARCVVKPATEGSALGVYLVDSAQEANEAVANVFEIDDKVLVERYIKGTELTVAVLGNDDPTAFPVIEIVPQSEFYDFDSKYAPGGSQHICPARIDDDVAARVQECAIEAHKALGCAGVSRTDFILDEAGTPWILETNTIPGMTGTSLLPDAARAAGMTFPELVTEMIRLAFEGRNQNS